MPSAGTPTPSPAMENTCYHAKVMDTQVDTMVDILSDIFLNSVFDAHEVERERPVILQEIGMVEDSPDEYIHFLAGNTFWGDNPLGRSILGTRETIAQFGAEAIRGFFQRLYQPERIVIAAAGNLGHQRLVDLIGPAFTSVRGGKAFPNASPRPTAASWTSAPGNSSRSTSALGRPACRWSTPGATRFRC